MGGTAAVVGAIATVVGAGGQVYKSFQAASDRERAQKQLKKEQKQAKELHKDRTRRLLGAQAAAYGASGVRGGEGTPLDVHQETAAEAAKERDAIMKGYDYQSDVLQREEDRLRMGGLMSGGGTLLSGGARMAADPYVQDWWKKNNPFK